MALRLGVLAGMLVCNPLAGLSLPAPMTSFLTGIAALSLVFGLFTSWTALAGGVCAVLSLVQATPDLSAIALAAHVLSAIALTLLGPGAYSMDALLFGRRIVRISD